MNRNMANKIIIKNKIKNEELAKRLKEEADKKMLWRIQKDRKKEKENDGKKTD